MFSGARRYVSYANIVATLALLFAMSGGALAAKHYLISSTKQISPKVLKKLKGNKGASGAPGTQGPAGAQGKEGAAGASGTTVVARVRGAAPVTSTKSLTAYALSGATWSQGANEAEQIVGTVTATAPPVSKCSINKTEDGSVFVLLLIDEKPVAEGFVADEAAEQKKVTTPMFTVWGATDPGTTTSHTATAEIQDNCGQGGGVETSHFTVESVNVDVLGAH